MTEREIVIAALVVVALAVGGRRWVGQYRAQAAAVPARPTTVGGRARAVLAVARKVATGRSDRDTISWATAAGILLAAPAAGPLVQAVAAVAAATGLDAKVWAPAGADLVVLALVGLAALDLTGRGLWRGTWLRPALRHSLIGLCLPTVIVAGLPLLGQTVVDAVKAVGDVPAPAACVPDGSAAEGVVDELGVWGSPERLANAATIVQVGREMGVPERGQWIALATAMQESGLRNIDYGDRDSLGLFQQRPSQGWGTPDQVRDPRYAATQFYDRLLKIPDWQRLPLWQAAQTVQRSAYPTAYAKHEDIAARLVGAATNITCRS